MFRELNVKTDILKLDWINNFKLMIKSYLNKMNPNTRKNYLSVIITLLHNDYDKNKDKVLDKSEVAQIQKEAFSYVSNFNYFTFIKVEKKKFDVKQIKKFSAKLKSNKLIYTFFIPCSVTITNSIKQVTVASYDPSYYSALFFSKKNPVSLNNPDEFYVKTELKEDKSVSIYFGQIHPWTLFIDFSKKQ